MNRNRLARQWQPETSEKKIERLEEEIKRLRMIVLRTAVPDEHLMLFQGYRACKTRDEYFEWQHRIREVVLEMGRQQAKDVKDDYGLYVTARTHCPLCRESNTVGGWAWPRGLEQHLDGTYRQEKCDVLRVVTQIADDYLHEHGFLAELA